MEMLKLGKSFNKDQRFSESHPPVSYMSVYIVLVNLPLQTGRGKLDK